MKRLVINGGNKLSGEVKISGAKNSVLPILAATAVTNNISVIHNCPCLSDVEDTLKILEYLGCKVKRSNSTVTVDSSSVIRSDVPEHLMRRMRCSVIFAGSLLSRCGNAVISRPGGCEIGKRPIDLHLFALKTLGAQIEEKNGNIIISAKNGLSGDKINFPILSVGATENAILAAVKAKGITVINNAAREPEISDLANFLNKAGAKIIGAGSNTITVTGVEEFGFCEHTVIPDRIEAATFMSAAAVTASEITLNGINGEHLGAVISAFRNMGCDINIKNNSLSIYAPKRLKRIAYLKSYAYPAFPTDAGPIITASLIKANGTSVFSETVFENRFRYTSELIRLGADIKTEGSIAVIEGVKELTAANCVCTDLRGGAAIAVASLAAKGRSVIDNADLIYRGYENFETKLCALGAEVFSEEV